MEEIYFEIENYLGGEMNEQERIAFEEKCEQDAVLKKKVQDLKEVRESLKAHWEQAEAENKLRQTTDNLNQEFFLGAMTKKPTLFRRITGMQWAMAAAIALFVSAVLFFLPITEKDLYASYRKFPKAALILRASTSDVALAEGEKAFNEGRYGAALEYFEAYLNTNPQNSEVQFFKALSEIETAHFEAAKKSLTNLQLGESLWAMQAEWYLALLHLKMGDLEAATTQLKNIAPTSENYTQAQQLLSDLKK